MILEGAARAAVSGPDAPDTGELSVVLAPGSGDDTIAAITAESATGQPNTRRSHRSNPADRGLRQGAEILNANRAAPAGSSTTDLSGVVMRDHRQARTTSKPPA